MAGIEEFLKPVADHHEVPEKRDSGAGAELLPPRRDVRSMLALIGLALVLVALFVYVGRDWLRPALAVTGVRAVAMKVAAAELAASSPGQVLFQASGWIEPDPYPVKATSFVDGVVDEVRILDGQFVHRGDVLAVLDDRNLRLAIAEIEAEVAAMAGDIKVLAEQIGEAERQIALSGERLTTAEAEMARLQRQSEILQRAGEAISLIQREDARLAFERQRNVVQEAIRERELREATLRVVRAQEDAARHRLASLKATLARSQLDLERTVIRSPIAGMVQRVQVQIGQKIQSMGDMADSATIATLYDPAKLQVRVDVALADAAGMIVGMPAQVITDALPGVRLAGRVTSLAGQADIAKNTLQAKVGLLDPHVALRPEMLARVEFLPVPPPDAAKNAAGDQGVVHALVPENALHDLAERNARAWVAAREGAVAELREVSLGDTRAGAWREVRTGVSPGEIVITSRDQRLQPGRRVAVTIAPPPTTVNDRGDTP